MKRSAFFNVNPETIDRVYGKGRKEKIGALTNLYPQLVTRENFAEHAKALKDLQVIFSTWGMPGLSPEEIEQLPALRAIFYAAGSVKSFAKPFLEKGIQVVSAWAANAVPVAEFTLAQILLANKGYFRNEVMCQSFEGRHAPRFHGPGNFGETVSLLGAGMIGRKLIELLKNVDLQILVWDPFLSEEHAGKLGVEKSESLEDAFSRGYVVSNHLANVPETRGLLRRNHFMRMRPNATFINTGRGATVMEEEMLHVMRERTDLTALLDVTNPEPPQKDSLMYALPNIRLTSHIAGALGDEVVRMADWMIDEFQAWAAERPLRYEVSLEMLSTMA